MCKETMSITRRKQKWPRLQGLTTWAATPCSLRGRGRRTESLSGKSVNPVSACALFCHTARRRRVGEGEPLQALGNGFNRQRWSIVCLEPSLLFLSNYLHADLWLAFEEFQPLICMGLHATWWITSLNFNFPAFIRALHCVWPWKCKAVTWDQKDMHLARCSGGDEGEGHV